MVSQLLLPLRSYKYLLYQLTQREIKSRYKQSFVGYAWVLINPLLQLMVYTFVFSTIFRSPTDVPYVVYVYAGLLPWTTFSSSLMVAVQSLVDNASLLKKVSFPREVIPYSAVAAKLVDLGFSSFVFFGLCLVLRVPLGATAPIFFFLLGLQLILALGLALLFSAANLFYRDVQYLINLLLMLWMYMTPVVYPLSLVPEKYVWYYKLNPMVGIMEGYRSALFGQPFEWTIIAWSAFCAVATFVVGYWFFKKLEPTFADIV